MGALLAALGAGVLATAAPASPSPPATPDDATSTAVDLRAADNRMTVDVTIDGAGPFRFIVDSGATRTVISRRLATLLGLPDAGGVVLHSVGGVGTVPSVRIDRLVLGDLPARPIVAPVLDEADLGGAGILGIDALAGRRVVIDLLAHRMTVLPGERRAAPARSDEIVVVARRRYGQLVLADADAAGQRIWAIVDTGSMVTIGDGVLRDRLVRRRRAAPVATVITDVAGHAINATLAPISDIRIGAFQMHGLTIAFDDAHAFDCFGLRDKPAMLLGMDMMRSFARVSIDFQRRTVRLLRRHDSDGPISAAADKKMADPMGRPKF